MTEPSPLLLDRRAFIALGAAGVAAFLASCASDDTAEFDTANERVIVVGAGPAGMTAAHLLRQRRVDVQILEAGPTHGGRIKHNLTFTDFPISLGGEWIHVEAEILDEIVNDPSVTVATKVVPYQPDDVVGSYRNGSLELGRHGPSEDFKFVGSSWLDFFDEHIVPGIEGTMVFDTQVISIDYSGDEVRLVDANGGSHVADRVIFAAPLKVLQRGDVSFTPELPQERLKAIEEANIWSGLKMFLEFTEEFYPVFLELADSATADGQRLYYDAAYGQDAQANILGLFSVGAQAETYQALSEDELLAEVLGELDQIFDGVASQTYVRHLVQNWNDEPYAGAAYLEDDAPSSTTERLSGSIDGKLFFAGDAYTSFDDWSSVHTAVRSAAEAVNDLLG